MRQHYQNQCMCVHSFYSLSGAPGHKSLSPSPIAHQPQCIPHTHPHIQHTHIQATARPIRHPAMEEDGQGGKRRRILLDEDEDEEEQSLAAPAAPARAPPPLSPLPSDDSRRARDDEDSDVCRVGYWNGYGLGRSGMDPWVVCFLPSCSWVVCG